MRGREKIKFPKKKKKTEIRAEKKKTGKNKKELGSGLRKGKQKKSTRMAQG
jgi:hypothetical protein